MKRLLILIPLLFACVCMAQDDVPVFTEKDLDSSNGTGYELDNGAPYSQTDGLAQVEYLNGHGKDVSKYFRLNRGLTLFTMSHSGYSNFAVILYSKEGEYVELLANEIGSYNGKKMVPIDKNDTYVLDIEADGAWTIKIEPQ